MEFIGLVPAYGRDYKSAKSVKQDWEDGKDFKVVSSGQYINKEDAFRYAEHATIMVRYNKLTKVTTVQK